MSPLQESLRVFQAAACKKAAVVLDLASLARIKRMVGQNHHSEAYALGAEILGLKHLANKFSLVQQLQRLEGHMPKGLSDYQYKLYKDLMNSAKQILSPEDYDQFYSSF